MSVKYKGRGKTLGPRAAQLIAELNERGRSTFKVADVVSITGLSMIAARNLVHRAQLRGVVARLKPGLYNLVPYELGWSTVHTDSPYMIARELAGGATYFLSHGTAMELNRMVTQPNFTVYVSCTRRVHPQRVGGYDFRFVQIQPDQEFGQAKHWIEKSRFVVVSDVERTVVDGLRQPAYCGGITEVAKGLWMKRETLKIERLIDYAKRLGTGAVFRRLGYLLEHYGLADTSELEQLRGMLTATYQRLDPSLSAGGAFLSSWRIQLNVTPEELDAVRLG